MNLIEIHKENIHEKERKYPDAQNLQNQELFGESHFVTLESDETYGVTTDTNMWLTGTKEQYLESSQDISYYIKDIIKEAGIKYFMTGPVATINGKQIISTKVKFYANNISMNELKLRLKAELENFDAIYKVIYSPAKFVSEIDQKTFQYSNNIMFRDAQIVIRGNLKKEVQA